MAFFSGKIPKKFKYPLASARTVCLVKAIEESEAGQKYWSKEKADEVTRSLMAETEDKSDAARFIEQRAQLAFSKMAKESPSLRTMKLSYGTGILTAIVLVLGSYLVGAFGERFLATGTEINLFSPLFLAAIGWSLFLYAALFLLALVSTLRRRHTEFPLRTTLAKFAAGLFAPKLITSSLRQEFLKIWAPATLRLAQFRISRVLHWAFLAFVAGIASSIAVRGLSGSYIIGWELPGLNNAPDQVRDIFQALWGWIPQILNLPALPDAETVAAMRLDRLAMAPETAGSIAPASAWIPRLVILFGAVILVPRLLLIAWDTVAIKYLRSHVAVPTEGGYFESILKTDPAAPAPAPEPEAKAEDKPEEKAEDAPEAKAGEKTEEPAPQAEPEAEAESPKA